VTLGLIASLAHPGGNATGANFLALEVDAKRFELMHELLPKASRIAVLINPVNVRYGEATTKTLTESARTIGVAAVFFNAGSPGEIDAAFTAMERERADAVFIATEAFFANRGAQLAALALRYRKPGCFSTRELVHAGLLMSCGASINDMARQVGVYTGSILKGAKPADLPVVQATKFEFVINMQTAKALGIQIPPMLLARADEVIE
jgi:putative tryptophan/tyrosine transport system substrate-binding protein